jgi:hypothetical protein
VECSAATHALDAQTLAQAGLPAGSQGVNGPLYVGSRRRRRRRRNSQELTDWVNLTKNAMLLSKDKLYESIF